jgi:hypothetical protein
MEDLVLSLEKIANALEMFRRPPIWEELIIASHNKKTIAFYWEPTEKLLLLKKGTISNTGTLQWSEKKVISIMELNAKTVAVCKAVIFYEEWQQQFENET